MSECYGEVLSPVLFALGVGIGAILAAPTAYIVGHIVSYQQRRTAGRE